MIFGRKKCPQCGNKIEKKFNFCPWCGLNAKDKKDFFMPSMPNFKIGFPFNAIFKQFEKEIQKQFKDMDEDISKPEKSQGIKISISTGNSGNPLIKINNMNEEMGNMIKPVRQAKIKQVRISEKDAEKFSKLPKKEPLANVRRLTDRIIYEIELPGVKDKNNVIINKLHNSIEIRAYSEKNAFFKLIPIALPILRYALEKEKLILELKPEN